MAIFEDIQADIADVASSLSNIEADINGLTGGLTADQAAQIKAGTAAIKDTAARVAAIVP